MVGFNHVTTYARLDANGFAVDVIVTPPELVARFHPDWLAQQTFVVVPDGTMPGAALTITNGIASVGPNPLPPAPPPNPSVISGLSFLKRFTVGERAAIMGSGDNTVKAFQFEMQIASAGGDVNLLDPDMIAGVNYLVTATILTSQRATQILTP